MDITNIITSTVAFLLLSLVSLIVWTFKSISDNQKTMLCEIQSNNMDMIKEKTEANAARKRNDEIDAQMKKSMAELAAEMNVMAKNINKNHFSVQEHNLRIMNLEDQHKIIAQQLRNIA